MSGPDFRTKLKEQLGYIENSAEAFDKGAHLELGGCFVIEVFVPEVRRCRRASGCGRSTCVRPT